MAGLASFLNSGPVQKYFPFRNATPRSSVSLALLYDLGVAGSNKVAGVGDLSEIEKKIANLEARDVAREAEVKKLSDAVYALQAEVISQGFKVQGNTKAIDETILPKLDALQQELDDFTAGTNYKCDQLALATQQQRQDIDQTKTELALHVNNGEHWTGQQIDDRINAIVNP